MQHAYAHAKSKFVLLSRKMRLIIKLQQVQRNQEQARLTHID